MPRWPRAVVSASVVTVLAACGGAPPEPAPPEPVPSEPVPVTDVHVEGNRLVDQHGRTLRPRGFNVSGAEYACIEGQGFFDTPDGRPPGDAVVIAMRKRWRGANTIRVPLNEQCWLGLPAADRRYAGEAYRAAVRSFVERLNAKGFVAILDLHRSAPGSGVSKEQEQMPDRDHSPAFWASMATTFRSGAVLFDLFNEPFPDAVTGGDAAWTCWRSGGCTLKSVNTGQDYVAAGMNELIAAIRATGARTPVMAGGIYWAESLSRWWTYRPADPAGQLVASFHAYSFNTYCAAVPCYERELAPIAARVPLIAGEVGPTLDTDPAAVDRRCPASAVRHDGWAHTTLDWLDAHGVGWTAWSFNPWGDCWALVRDWGGEPTPIWGAELQRRLAT